MIDYAYHNLFYKSHQTKDILIVDSGATVTPVSGEAPTVTGATIKIHTEDIKSESFTLDESLCSQDDLKFGLCDSASVSFTIKNKADIPNLKDTEYSGFLNVYMYFNGDSDTLFQIGQYECDKDDYTNNRKLRDVVLYDALYNLNNLDITPWYNNYFNTYPESSVYRQIVWVIADLFNWIQGNAPYDGTDEVSKASPQLPVELDSEYSLCNGGFAINKTIESDIVTFNFFMEGLLEFNGSFGHITREGKFKIITMEWYSADPVREVTDDFRIPPTNYDDVATWGIGQIKVYDQNNSKKFTVRNTTKKYPSTYVFVDPWILADRESGDSTVQEALERLQWVIYHLNYTPNETQCSGDLCVEVGDRINIVFGNPAPEDTKSRLRSYVLERHFIGFGSMKDTYTAKGNKKQPEYKPDNNNWHVGDSTTGTSGEGTGSVSEVNDEHDKRYVELQRNYGLRVLNEPTVDLEYDAPNQQVKIKWTDPSDITDYKPVPCEWDSTVVVRKEGSAPLHIWDGTILVTSTTRDEYSSTAYIDNTIEANKKYYYGIFPCHVALDDAEHPIKHYRFTKVYSVDTVKFLVAPTLFPIRNIDGTTAIIAYHVPILSSGSYSTIKLVGKKGGIPTSKTDGDVSRDLEPSSTLISAITISGLDENTTYYFVIFVEDSDGLKATSEAQEAIIGEDEGYNFDYTGTIQEFTAPKTGIYQLETWGAQGGIATDENDNVARGGYGAYAYGEVLLNQGDKLYINVGGQNGYGGGGNSSVKYLFEQILIQNDFTHTQTAIESQSGSAYIPSDLRQYLGTDYMIYWGGNNSRVYRPMLKSDNIYSFAYAGEGADSWELFPINLYGTIKKVKISIMCTGSPRQYTSGRLYLYYAGETDSLKRILDFNHSRTDTPINVSSLNTWYDFEIDLDDEAPNYFEIFCAEGGWSFKNIEFICEV